MPRVDKTLTLMPGPPLIHARHTLRACPGHMHFPDGTMQASVDMSGKLAKKLGSLELPKGAARGVLSAMR